ncbi:hypothetical protein BH11MYX1_BH11MYX1_24040 [soil metagenome]
MSWAIVVVQALLFGDATAPDCSHEPDPIACLIDARFAHDPKAQAIAHELYKTSGDIAAPGVDEMMDGGFRGTIHLVPELPIGAYRKHLEWIAATAATFETFYAKQFARQPPAYRWRDLAIRFVRSAKKHTPSAYAVIGPHEVWTIEYNVEGSLPTSETGVRELIVHELFHVNDEDHQDWSHHALATDYAAIVKKCGTRTACLDPYAPNDTKMRATGIYYAFQPNNGETVHEYAAELAVRYFKEQSEMMAKGKLARRGFKCGPPENARAWKSMVDEFFAGEDQTPAC